MNVKALPLGWELTQQPGSPSAKTIKFRLASVRSLAAFPRANDMPGAVDDVTAEGIRAVLWRAGAPSRRTPGHTTKRVLRLLAGER